MYVFVCCIGSYVRHSIELNKTYALYLNTQMKMLIRLMYYITIPN